jgi:hypothetical protein
MRHLSTFRTDQKTLLIKEPCQTRPFTMIKTILALLFASAVTLHADSVTPQQIVAGKPTPARANNAGLAFFDAGLDDEPSIADRRVSLIPGKSLTIAAAGTTLTTLKIATDTGLISGGFTLTDVHPVTPGAKPIVRKPTFQGIVVRTPSGGQEGHGFFLLQQLPEPVFPQPSVLPILSGAVILE